jgi:hypothetical protein
VSLFADSQASRAYARALASVSRQLGWVENDARREKFAEILGETRGQDDSIRDNKVLVAVEAMHGASLSYEDKSVVLVAVLGLRLADLAAEQGPHRPAEVAAW